VGGEGGSEGARERAHQARTGETVLNEVLFSSSYLQGHQFSDFVSKPGVYHAFKYNSISKVILITFRTFHNITSF
jgi:hypothetical protein